jgi:N-glycosylase/DNA lyase
MMITKFRLLKEIKLLKKSPIRKVVEQRLREFKAIKNKPNEDWFSELCFCILTANSKARTAIKIQDEIGSEGFLDYSLCKLVEAIKRNKHRFHNNKAKFITLARKHHDIKEKVVGIIKKHDEREAREWIVKNIKGIGYKEASHFLRNVGYFNLAILDRHILNLMKENKIIKERPKTLNKKTYLKIEEKFITLARNLKMQPAELDMYMWYMKAGAVLK